MKVIILAAGMGSRLGGTLPKPLTSLADGTSIMQRQLRAIRAHVSDRDVLAVVGYKKEVLMEAFSELTFVYNAEYDTTNTARSLEAALKRVGSHDVVWLNGDVVFDPAVLERVIECPRTCMAVQNGSVGEEEVKYALDSNGFISLVSKEVSNPLGEAVGINKVVEKDIPALLEALARCEDNDYFERAVQYCIDDGMLVAPVDVSDMLCREIDFPEDLSEVNTQLRAQGDEKAGSA